MDDPAIVGHRHGARQGLDELGGRPGTRRALADPLVETASVDQLQREERQAVVLAGLVDLDDIGMRELGDGLGLGAESRQAHGTHVHPGEDHLQGDHALQTPVPGLVDHAHAAAPEFLQDVVTRHGHVPYRRGACPDRAVRAVAHGGPHIGIGEAELIRARVGPQHEFAGGGGIGPRHGPRSRRRVGDLEVGPAPVVGRGRRHRKLDGGFSGADGLLPIGPAVVPRADRVGFRDGALEDACVLDLVLGPRSLHPSRGSGVLDDERVLDLVLGPRSPRVPRRNYVLEDAGVLEPVLGGETGHHLTARFALFEMLPHRDRLVGPDLCIREQSQVERMGAGGYWAHGDECRQAISRWTFAGRHGPGTARIVWSMPPSWRYKS